MSKFQKKQISKGQILADRLRKTRLEKGISLEEVQEATKIQTKYLEILENGNYNKLPGDVYARAWIKTYAEFLELSSKELLTSYQVERLVTSKVKTGAKDKDERFLKHGILNPRFFRIFLIGAIILALLIYLGYEVNNIIAPPTVNILEPGMNHKTTESTVTIVGQTEPEVRLTINNELVLLDEEGKFNQIVNLAIGLNNLQISAKKKHSKTNYLSFDILRESLE